MNRNPCKSNQEGFIALTVVFFITSVLLALVAVSSIESANFFDQAMKKVYREMNYRYAYDCLDQAILGLARDYFFLVPPLHPQEISRYHCTILTIEPQGDLRIISARGDLQKAYVYRHATVRLRTHDLEVIKIE